MQGLQKYIESGQEVRAPSGACLFSPGDGCEAFLIVLSGAVRVEQTNPSGRTVVLYRVEAGDSCVMTTSHLLSGRPYAGYGYAEGALHAVSIPGAAFHGLLADDQSFRELVFENFAKRVGELTDVIDDLLQHRTDVRIAAWLSSRSGSAINKTQQELAQELGTVREVVSRTLKAFERQGWITLGRGSVTVLDADALTNYKNVNDV